MKRNGTMRIRDFNRAKPKGIKVVAVTPSSKGLRVNCDGVSVLVTREGDGVLVLVTNASPGSVACNENNTSVHMHFRTPTRMDRIILDDPVSDQSPPSAEKKAAMLEWYSKNGNEQNGQ